MTPVFSEKPVLIWMFTDLSSRLKNWQRTGVKTGDVQTPNQRSFLLQQEQELHAHIFLIFIGDFLEFRRFIPSKENILLKPGQKQWNAKKKTVRLWSVCSFTSRFLLVIIIIFFYFLFFSAAVMPKEAATKVNRLRMHNDNTHHTKNIGAHEEKKYVL